ncbi:MAG: S41 family peptidase [Chloroflexi bacterium]|nr:S41 family peptidase [Chloroflexota bacterium]
MKKFNKVITAILALILASISCQAWQTSGLPGVPATTSTPAMTAGPTIQAPVFTSSQPYKITGTFKSTSEIGGEFSDNVLYAERQVILVDLHGFITRNKEWEVPVNSQVIGHVQYDPKNASGFYELILPGIPQGTLNDVDNNGQQNAGVEVFVMDYEPNIANDPFLSGDDRLRGWPGNQSSIKTNPDDDGEVTGGKLIVYAPESGEGFPTGFGADGKLFTADDPIAPLPAGYSVINLDTNPFTVSQSPEAELPLYEAPDAGPKDYSKDSYTQSFDNLLKFLSTEYAFNGIDGKQPDYQQLIAQIRPRVEQAEKDKNAQAFYAALRDLTYAFKDGHVGVDGGDLSSQDFRTNYSGSLGFTVRVLDDNQVLVNSVLSGGPAEKAGMKIGALITQFDGKSVMDAIQAQTLFFGNKSSDVSILYSKAVVLTRTKPGAVANVTFKNPGGQEKSAQLTSIPEVDSLLKELGYDKSEALLPVELQTLTVDGKDIGYIKINSNLDDLNLILRLFERGLKKFQEQKVAGIIIDLRKNSGGVNLGLAGFLTDQEIPIGLLEYYDSTQGKFAAKDKADRIIANQNQYRFDEIAVLVGLSCASACELEAYGFSKVPGAVVVGQYPTGGIEAEVSKGQIKMPESISMQFPTGRKVLEDGSLFLEGVGVQPTIKVPVNAENVLTSEDIILKAAQNAILGK